jgi:hypothetical protein
MAYRPPNSRKSNFATEPHDVLGSQGSTGEGIPTPEAPAPLLQPEPMAVPQESAEPPPPPAEGLKWCQKGFHQYPPSRKECPQCATARKQRSRARQAEQQRRAAVGAGEAGLWDQQGAE